MPLVQKGRAARKQDEKVKKNGGRVGRSKNFL